MRRTALAAAVISVLLLAAPSASAQIDIGMQGSYDTEGLSESAFGVGARASLGIPLPVLPGIRVQGTYDWFFADASDYWVLAGNILLDVPLPAPTLNPYVGGGLLRLVPSDGDVDDDAAQILGGVDLDFPGGASPFVEVRYQFRRLDNALIIGGGITF